MIIIEDKSVQNTLKFPKNTDGIAVSLKLYSELTHFTKTYDVEDLGTSSMYFTISISFDEVPDGEYVYTIASEDSKTLSSGYLRIGDIDSDNTIYDYTESYITYDPETGESNIVAPYLLTDVTLQVDENGDMVIDTPDGYDGISKVNLTVNVSGGNTKPQFLLSIQDDYLEEDEELFAFLDFVQSGNAFTDCDVYLNSFNLYLGADSFIKQIDEQGNIVVQLTFLMGNSICISKFGRGEEGFYQLPFEKVVTATLDDLDGYVSTDEFGNLSNLTTATKTNLVNAVNEVNTIAKGATRAVSFYNYSHLVSMLQSGQYSDLRVGQNLYINYVGVPDLWIVTAGLPNITYTYTTDEAFIEYVKTSGRVGPYHLGFLETEKVYLDNYYTKTEVDELIDGVDSYDGNIYLSGSSDSVDWMRAQNKKVWDMLEAGTYKGGFLVQYSSNNIKKVSLFTEWGTKMMDRYTFTAEYYDGSTQQMYYNSVSLWETSASISAYNSHTIQRKLTAGDGIEINGTTISNTAGVTYGPLQNKVIIPIEGAKAIGLKVNFKYTDDGYIFGAWSSNGKQVAIKVVNGVIYFNDVATEGSLTKGNTYDLYLVYNSDTVYDTTGYVLILDFDEIATFDYNNLMLGEGNLYISVGSYMEYDSNDLYAEGFRNVVVVNSITTIKGFNYDEDLLSYFDYYPNKAYVINLSYTVHKFIGKTEGTHHFIYDVMTGWERMID